MKAARPRGSGKLRHETIFNAQAQCPVIVVQQAGQPARTLLAYHRACEFQLILKGRGEYLIGGKKYAIRPNMALALQPNQAHCYLPAPGGAHLKWMLMFAPEFLRAAALQRLAREAPAQALLLETEAAALALLFRQLHDELTSRGQYWREIVRLKLGEFLWLLQRAGARPAPAPVVHPLAQQIAEYLEREFTRPLDMAELARRFGYSESHLAHVFKGHMRISIKQYLLQRRIAEARRRLEESSQLKAAAVAAEVGFHHYGLFQRKFKQWTGVTPAVYCRNAHPDCRI